MNREELVDLLEKIATNDIEDGADIFDHPCSVAVRAINKAFDDIETLIKIAPKGNGSKKVQMLASFRYNPSW